MICYDYIINENDDNKDIFSKYLKQEIRFRKKFSGYIEKTTLRYEEINRRQPVKEYNINSKENDNV